MRSALVRFYFPDGRLASVPAGGLLGRLATASLRFEDPRVSEAHALVSLREGRLWLLSLRGAVEVDGAVVSEVRLQVGQRIRLAEGVTFQVESVELPSHALALELPDGTLAPLLGEVVSVLGPSPQGPPLKLVPHFADPALARAWPVGGGWRILVSGQRPKDLVEGMELSLGGYRVAVREVPPFGAAPTVSRGRLHDAVTLTLTFSEARVERQGRPPVHLSGYDARILGELSAYAEPVPWELVAREIWSGDDAVRLRQSWDKAVNRLRQHLLAHGLRDDLVRSDGRGNVGLNLGAGDVVDASGLG